MNRNDALRAYAATFENLRIETLAELEALLDEQVRFRDPFNDFRGRERLLGLFRKMFDSLQEPGFAVTDQAVGQEAGYLRWTFTFRRAGKAWRIEGVSEVHFGADGRVTAHLDHWDSGPQFYEKLPLLGPAVRFVRRKLSE